MKIACTFLALVLLVSATLPSTPELGKAEGRCRSPEPGPALLIDVTGLKDRQGNLKLEVYPATDADFLQDDNVLIEQGKVFRRVEVSTPAAGPVQLCIRVPHPGPYAVSLLHDRDMNRKFGWTIDGIGFGGNPRLGFTKPKVREARVVAGPGLTRISIVLNYRRGFGVGPLSPR